MYSLVTEKVHEQCFIVIFICRKQTLKNKNNKNLLIKLFKVKTSLATLFC